MSFLNRHSLTFQLLVASSASLVALVAVYLVGITSLTEASDISSAALRGQVALLDDSSAFEALLYQKGYIANYMLTRDREYLDQLLQSQKEFQRWLERAFADEPNAEERSILDELRTEERAFARVGDQAVAAFEAGRSKEALELLDRSQASIERMRVLCTKFFDIGRAYAERDLESARRTTRHRAALLLLASVLGALAALAVGFLLSRRITRPIYELQLQVESAMQRTRVKVPPGGPGLEALGEHVAVLLHKLEETDAAILEHRRRLVQSEKLSAIGEVAAKLAHEVLNPLAGMKAAAQVLLREAQQGQISRQDLTEIATSLDHEVTRVEQLVRRLVQFARPLEPQVQMTTVRTLLDSAIEAARRQLVRADAHLVVEEEPGLPPVELDSVLVTQALCNLLTNAAEASPAGGCVTVRAGLSRHLGQDYLSIQVLDEGPGLDESQLGQLFHPFFTTKRDGTGLGLAVTQHIVTEHSGQVTARNRSGQPGARFDVLLPLRPSATHQEERL